MIKGPSEDGSSPPEGLYRYHGLDGLRGFAMLLGIALHGSLPYFSRMSGFEHFWPADDDQSILIAILFDFIHTWRMPTFFLLAGFFAHLVLSRRPTRTFVLDRLKRIGLPLVLFGAIMAVVVPPIWIYGWTGNISLDIFKDVLADRQDLDSSGDLVAHLWFLYYLLIMYGALLAIRSLAAVWRRWAANRPSVGRGLSILVSWLADAAYSRVPVLLVLGVVLLLVLRDGNESKPLWPLNVPDVLYGMIFFLYGHGLYAKRDLIEKLKGTTNLGVLWGVATAMYLVHLWLLGAIDDVSNRGEASDGLWAIESVFYGASAVLFSLGFVGLFERVLAIPRAWVRWLADSSYWIYIIHLPVVAFMTFYLAHLDRQGWLKYLTGIGWSGEMKFLVSCLVTGVLGVVTYRYLVRYTPIGTLLNGKRTKTLTSQRTVL
ncbi:MAG: acyltransferase family protein [Dehalococcoidia bacterium]|nr:acyltransferase family protein [Dehalococcoidia bacterium]